MEENGIFETFTAPFTILNSIKWKKWILKYKMLSYGNDSYWMVNMYDEI